MSWTNIPNGNLAIGAPIRSIDQLALRDNPIAIAEGATGAPRIIAEALNGGQSGTAPIYAARAWVNFNGTTATPSTIRGSGNVSSITRNSTGYYTISLTTAMPNSNYCAVATCGQSTARTSGGASASIFMSGYNADDNPNTTSFAIFLIDSPTNSNATTNSPYVCATIFG
jgi:hypothetical protein